MCVTIVLSELISVVATAVVKSNKNHHLSILRIVVVVEILRRLAGDIMIYAQGRKIRSSKKCVILTVTSDSTYKFLHGKFSRTKARFYFRIFSRYF